MGYLNIDVNAMPTYQVDPVTGSPVTPNVSAALPAGVDRSGTAGTSSAQLAPANTVRRGLNIQNVSANTIGINEFGGAAVIGSSGTYTLPAGQSANVRTSRQVNVVGSAAGSNYTATEF